MYMHMPRRILVNLYKSYIFRKSYSTRICMIWRDSQWRIHDFLWWGEAGQFLMRLRFEKIVCKTKELEPLGFCAGCALLELPMTPEDLHKTLKDSKSNVSPSKICIFLYFLWILGESFDSLQVDMNHHTVLAGFQFQLVLSFSSPTPITILVPLLVSVYRAFWKKRPIGHAYRKRRNVMT